MDLSAKLASIEQKLHELAQQRAETQELLTRIAQQQLFCAGQRQLLVEMLEATPGEAPIN